MISQRLFVSAFAIAAMAVSGCAPKAKPIALELLNRPQTVLVVTLDRRGAPAVQWPPAFYWGTLFGAIGGAIDGALQASRDARLSAKLSSEIGLWDFRSELHHVFMSSAAPPPNWRWVDGHSLNPDLLSEITNLYSATKGSQGTLMAAYAAKEGIDKILVVEPKFYGIHRRIGYEVTLAAVLMEPTIERKVSWEGWTRDPRFAQASVSTISDYDRNPVDANTAKEMIVDRARTKVSELLAVLTGAPADGQ